MKIFRRVGVWWKEWERAVLTVISLIVVSVGSFLLGMTAHPGRAQESLTITQSAPENTVLCSAQCDTLGVSEAAVSGEDEIAVGTPAVDDARADAEDARKCAFVGSINGTKYYPPDCKAVARINPENLTCFASAEDATAKGYTRTKSC